jgi:hypothetical protein
MNDLLPPMPSSGTDSLNPFNRSDRNRNVH